MTLQNPPTRLTLFAVVCCVVATKTSPAQPTPDSPAALPLVFERTTIDLGVVSDFDLRTETFVFVNTSPKPITIQIGGCHFCGIPTSDKPTYQPGERGMVFVEFNPSSRSGPMRAGGTVSIVGIAGFHVDLEVRATVRPKVWIEPDDVRLPEVVRGEPGLTTMAICGRDPNFHVVSIKSDQPWLDIALGEPVLTKPDHPAENEPPDSWRRIDAKLAAADSLPLGQHEAELTITTTDPDVPRRTCRVSINVVGQLVANPPQLMLGELTPAQMFMRQFVIHNRDGTPIFPSSVEIASAGIFQDLALDGRFSPTGFLVIVSGRAPARPINFADFKVRVRTARAGGPDDMLEVPIGCVVRNAEQTSPRDAR